MADDALERIPDDADEQHQDCAEHPEDGADGSAGKPRPDVGKDDLRIRKARQGEHQHSSEGQGLR